MRHKGTGTYQPYSGKVGGTWVLKELRLDGVLVQRNISKSERQLTAILGVDVPLGRKSEPYWRQYLNSVREAYARSQSAQSPVPQRIASLERVIEQFRDEGRDTTGLEQELIEARSISPLDAHQSDSPIIHPDMRDHAAAISILRPLDDVDVAILNSLARKPVKKTESIRHEMENYLKHNKGKRQFLDFFYEVTGNIRLQEIDTEHYRKFIDKVKSHPAWSERTQYNYKREVDTFLMALTKDHKGLHYSFTTNKLYRIVKPDGEKVQWTLDEVKRALQHATGVARTAIMLSLNCGFYRGDIAELTTEHFDGTHITKSRAKNKRNGKASPFAASWLVWEETKKSLAFGLTEKKIAESFQAFRDELGLVGDDGLPAELKALRKTVAQWINDESGEEEARLYRCEKMSGTHGKFYVKFSEAQRDKLDVALKHIEGKLFS